MRSVFIYISSDVEECSISARSVRGPDTCRYSAHTNKPFSFCVSFSGTDVTTQLFPTTVNPQQWLPPFEAPMAPSTSYTWSSEVPSVHQQPIVPSEETPNYVYFSEHSNNYVSLEPANQSADTNLPTSQLTNNQTDQMPCNVEVADWMLPDLSPEFMNKVLEALDQADSKGNVLRTRRDGEVDSLSDCFRKNKI